MSDLHLSLGTDKPMEVFGSAWDNYIQRIYDNWSSCVSASDTVLVGGDISWAMHLNDCTEDFAFIDSLPGRKLLFKGNHDYWWESMTKMNSFLTANGFQTIEFMQNNAVICEDCVITGTRGWSLPGDGGFGEDDEKIYNRELLRLELSLQDGERLLTQTGIMPDKKICVLHYPPFTREHIPDEGVVSLMEKYGITHCFYGHLHSHSAYNSFEGAVNGIQYRLTSADYLKFTPFEV